MTTQGAFGLQALPAIETRSAAAAAPFRSDVDDPCPPQLVQLHFPVGVWEPGSSAQDVTLLSQALDLHYAGAGIAWQAAPRAAAVETPPLPRLELCSSRSSAYEEAGLVLRSAEEQPARRAELTGYLRVPDARWRSVLLGRMADEEFEVDECVARAVGELLSVHDADLAQAALLALRFGGVEGHAVLKRKLRAGRLPLQALLEQLAAYEG